MSETGMPWDASSPLNIVWIIGTCGESEVAKKLPRKKCAQINISNLTELVSESMHSFNLRIAGILTVGLSRIYHRKMHLLERDTRALLELKNNLADPNKARHSQVTLPEVYNEFELCLDPNDLANDLNLIQTPSRTLQSCDQEVPRLHPDSLSSSLDSSFTADDRDITLNEGQVSTASNSFEESYIDEGFGDGEQSFKDVDGDKGQNIGDGFHNINNQSFRDGFHDNHSQSQVVEGGRERANPADTSHDQVLLLDDESGSFVPMGGDDDYSGDSVVPELPSPASLVCSFESPFMDPGNPLHPITPPSVRTRPPSLHSRPLSDHPHSQNRPPSLHNQTPLSSLFPLEELRPEDLPPKRSRCRKKRDTGVDKEVSLPEDQPEGEQLPLVFGTRPRNKMPLLNHVKTQKLSLSKVFFGIESPELLSMLQRLSCKAAKTPKGPVYTAHATPITPLTPFTPLTLALHTSTPELSYSDIEGGRKRYATVGSDQGSNLQGSQMSGRSLKSATPLQRPFSLIRGNPHMDPVGMVKELSPIADVEYEGEEDSYGGIGGADDDYSLDSLPQQKRSLSLNESTVMVFMRQVEVVLSDQPHTLFTVLLQDGCSRREAARTFLNLLCAVSTECCFRITQDEPYGPIIIRPRQHC